MTYYCANENKSANYESFRYTLYSHAFNQILITLDGSRHGPVFSRVPFLAISQPLALSNGIAPTATTLPFRFCISIEATHRHHFFSEAKGSRLAIAENGRNSPSLE